MELEGEDSGVGAEVGVGGEGGPVSREGDGADEDIGDGECDSFGPALVASLGGGFLVRRFDGFIGKRTKDAAPEQITITDLKIGHYATRKEGPLRKAAPTASHNRRPKATASTIGTETRAWLKPNAYACRG